MKTLNGMIQITFWLIIRQIHVNGLQDYADKVMHALLITIQGIGVAPPKNSNIGLLHAQMLNMEMIGEILLSVKTRMAVPTVIQEQNSNFIQRFINPVNATIWFKMVIAQGDLFVLLHMLNRK